MWQRVSQMNRFGVVKWTCCYLNHCFRRFAFNIKSGNAMLISLRFFRN